ncbi:hypothetical protein L7F22_014535 [Adiantum nelumboides]|nr:hypothetical protein [Adiantum nelumboides]
MEISCSSFGLVLLLRCRGGLAVLQAATGEDKRRGPKDSQEQQIVKVLLMERGIAAHVKETESGGWVVTYEDMGIHVGGSWRVLVVCHCFGNRGKIIEQMKKDIGAQIRILSKEHLPTFASETNELAQVVSDEPAVRRALVAIPSRLHKNITATSGGYGHADGDSVEQLTIKILCPNASIGSIIGKDGSVIKNIRDKIAAKIKVEEEASYVLFASSTLVRALHRLFKQLLRFTTRRLVELQMDKERANHSFVVHIPTKLVVAKVGALL